MLLYAEYTLDSPDGPVGCERRPKLGGKRRADVLGVALQAGDDAEEQHSAQGGIYHLWEMEAWRLAKGSQWPMHA